MLQDSVLEYINLGPSHPPFVLTHALYTLCIALQEPDDVDLKLALGVWFNRGLAAKLPSDFITTKEEYIAEFERWDKDRDGYALHAPTVPLYDLLPMGDCIQSIHGHFLYDYHELAPKNLLGALRQQLRKNDANAHGISVYQRMKTKVPSPEELDWEPYVFVEKFLHHTPFYQFFCTRVPFRIKRERFTEHGALFARSGHGKSRALRAFVAQFLQEQCPPALFLIDSLGSLIEGIDRLDVFNNTLKDRLVILDPSRPEYMPRLNFFDMKSDDLCFYLFKAIDQSFTARQATMISYLMEYMRALPAPSVLKLIEVCESKANLYPEVLPKLSPFAQSFFEHQFYAGKSGDNFVQQTKAQIAQRLYTLGRLSKFNEMFSASDDLFDPYECMQQKRIVLINTDARSPDLGGLGEAGSAIFGRFILAQCLAAARRRPMYERHLALLVVDEAKAYMDEQSALILSDARQFGMGMLLASQQPHQLPEGVRSEINTNTSIRMMGNIEYAVASQYARDMRCEPDWIVSMKSFDRSHAEWATFVSGMDHAIKVNIPFHAIESMQKSANRVKASNYRSPEHAKQRPAASPQPANLATQEQSMVDPPQERPAKEPVREKQAFAESDEIKPGKSWD
jgi:hypothetical protein